MSNFTPNPNPPSGSSFFTRTVDMDQMSFASSSNRRITTETPLRQPQPSSTPKQVPPPILPSQLFPSSQASSIDDRTPSSSTSQNLELSSSFSSSKPPSIPPFRASSGISDLNESRSDSNSNGPEFPNDDELPDDIESDEDSIPADVSDNGGQDNNYVSIESIFFKNDKDMTLIFSASFGISGLPNIDEDVRFPMVCKKKGFKKSKVVPTPKSLKAEITRRATNEACRRIPKPSGWNVKKCKEWLKENGHIISKDDTTFLVNITENFYNHYMFSDDAGDDLVPAGYRKPKLCLLLMRLWTICCDPILRPLFVSRDLKSSKEDRDTGKETLRLEDGGSFYDVWASMFNNRENIIVSVCFSQVYWELEQSYVLPPPDANEILDAEQLKQKLVEARAKLSKVSMCNVYFYCIHY